MAEKTYNTFQIADICGVRPSTLIQWEKQNKTKAYVTPGGHRRILESDLLSFLEKYRFPIPEKLKKGLKRLFIIEDEASVGKMLERTLQSALTNEFQVKWIEDG